jgi:hypothetical protein
VIEWGTTPKDFLEKKAAMIWTTTGNLTNIRSNASFPFGVAMLPAKKHPGSPTGGGNFYLFAKTTPAEQQAALKFAKWATAPQRAAAWSIATGYVAVTPAAWETPERRSTLRRCRRRWSRATSSRPRSRTVDPRQPARDEGAQRRPAGCADRLEAARRCDARCAARGDAAAAVVQALRVA